MRVDAGADGGAAERDFGEFIECMLRARDAAVDRTGVAVEFLAKTNRRCILKMRAARLDDTVPGLRFRL